MGYHALPAEVRKRANKQFALLKADQQHPSLHFKKIRVRQTREVWSVRVTDRYRALAVRHNDAFVCFGSANMLFTTS